jgi:hypothetical protein
MRAASFRCFATGFAKLHAMASRAPLLASLLLTPACLGPNPYLDDEVSDEVETESGDSDGSTDSTTTDDTDDSESTEETTDEDVTTGPASCMNDMLDGNETATDCGGDCGPCGDGEACLMAEDCQSGVCDDTCQTAACDDDVLNGGELELDCGGPCGFCELSAFIPFWDDVDGRDSEFPSVAITDDGEIALGFSGSNEARLRWLQYMGAPLTSSAIVGETVAFAGNQNVPMVLRADESEPTVVAVVAGMDAMSTSNDLFMVEHALDGGEGETRVVFRGTPVVVQSAVASVSTQAVFAWKQDKQIYLRRRDFAVGNSEWIDLVALQAETMTGQFDGDQPDLAVDSNGTVVLVWSRCNKAGTPCSIAVRRFFDGDWIDPAPVVISATNVYMTGPHVAVDTEGRIALSWSLLDIGDSWAYARIFDADLDPEGDAWVLQSDFPQQVDTDVAALDDGSFAYVWTDVTQDRVHLRRFIGNDLPKLMNVGDEAPWPGSDQPASPALANANNRLVVVWSAVDGSFTQIHGQVLGY